GLDLALTTFDKLSRESEGQACSSNRDGIGPGLACFAEGSMWGLSLVAEPPGRVHLSTGVVVCSGTAEQRRERLPGIDVQGSAGGRTEILSDHGGCGPRQNRSCWRR